MPFPLDLVDSDYVTGSVAAIPARMYRDIVVSLFDGSNNPIPLEIAEGKELRISIYDGVIEETILASGEVPNNKKWFATIVIQLAEEDE